MKAVFDNRFLEPELRVYDGDRLIHKSKIQDAKQACINMIMKQTDNQFERIKLAKSIDKCFDLFKCNKIEVIGD